MRKSTLVFAAAAAVATPALAQSTWFDDATEAVGLGGINAARVCFADLTGDGRPDAVIDRRRVFLNVADAEAPHGFLFEEVADTGLPEPGRGDSLVFADLDNDGIADAILVRYLDVNADNYEPPAAGTPQRTSWAKGRGDGTFESYIEIEAAQPRTTTAIAVGDINRDGRLDLYLGNWYIKYGGGFESYHNDMLFQTEDGGFIQAPLLLDVRDEFDEEHDNAGRPTYGVMLPCLLGDFPQLLDLNYGRRANQLWEDGAVRFGLLTRDVAPLLGLDGDDIRHGRYPDWLKQRAKTDPRFDRPDEKPFRSHGNTFDAAVGDINNNGLFDLFFAEIAHGWAGDSSDRSRFLVQQPDGTFITPANLSVNRLPADPNVRNWNQGDMHCELADFDNDGRLDLLLSSGDYPDTQKLRLFRQQPDGTFADITNWVGLFNDGSQQFSVADVNGDGCLDILVGQSFNRMSAGQRAGRTPTVKLYLNRAADRNLGNAITLKLVGDKSLGCARDALGAVVRVTAVINGEPVMQSRQLIGIGGHAGTQHEFLIHVGIGDADHAHEVEITWPTEEPVRTTRHTNLKAGRHTIRLADHAEQAE